MRAADFLGFGRCFVALLEGGEFHLRHAVSKGESQRMQQVFPEGDATRALRAKEVFWTDEVRNTPGINLEALLNYEVHQFLAVPLLGANGEVLGMFGVLDRLDNSGISPEHIRRARALGNQVAVVFEVARKLELSEQHRRRAEALIELSREISGALRLPDFARRFLARAAELTGASSRSVGAISGRTRADRGLASCRARYSFNATGTCPGTSLGEALADLASRHPEPLISGSAADLLGAEVASGMGWSECTVVRIPRWKNELGLKNELKSGAQPDSKAE